MICRPSATKSALLAVATTLLLGGCCSAAPGREHPLPAALFAAHLRALEDGPAAKMTALAVPPFVVIGDGSASQVRTNAKKLVRWATTLLRAQFFTKYPRHIIDVWLFESERSYERNVRELFGDSPESPYGYYEPCDRALVINLTMGDGTLVHELVHPLMEADFPEAPTWLNEGLASLYEQPAELDGRIVGLPNWRLPRLQDAIKHGWAPSLQATMSASRRSFYRSRRRSLNYAVARYLCFYLQHRGLLERYYRKLRAVHDHDPDGIETLRQLLGQPNLAQLEQQWTRFVLGLEYP